MHNNTVCSTRPSSNKSRGPAGTCSSDQKATQLSSASLIQRRHSPPQLLRSKSNIVFISFSDPKAKIPSSAPQRKRQNSPPQLLRSKGDTALLSSSARPLEDCEAMASTSRGCARAAALTRLPLSARRIQACVGE